MVASDGHGHGDDGRCLADSWIPDHDDGRTQEEGPSGDALGGATRSYVWKRSWSLIELEELELAPSTSMAWASSPGWF